LQREPGAGLDTAEQAVDARAEAAEETKKRREILDGARRVFRAQGFDGASMGEIAKAAGVSKGTLYVYFENKVALFEALVEKDRGETAERLFALDEHDPDVESVLFRLGVSFMEMMVRPEQTSLIRMVLGAAEKFPSIGRRFYAAGPQHGTQRLAAYLAKQVAAGRLRVDDAELAAGQFLNLCHGSCGKKALFASAPPPAREEIERTVRAAVRVFFAAYGVERAEA
jgi:AcrR family transcriptional regulator